ncbi:hypothetical protein [Mumia zhuanghuii]|uniref:Uncharacterized protein n=1 Tax=Mumia zhuanghuii TaxID=2585211 RepID=A0A5C4LVT6_9ACTN|nr:hypothetical protein [Mumia zhuanghuii]TNC22703.1 hypothetical protein FHE65_35700 [Mumia zhuanghuii]
MVESWQCVWQRDRRDAVRLLYERAQRLDARWALLWRRTDARVPVLQQLRLRLKHEKPWKRLAVRHTVPDELFPHD